MKFKKKRGGVKGSKVRCLWIFGRYGVLKFRQQNSINSITAIYGFNGVCAILRYNGVS